MARESVLTQAERASFEIEHFIFHIIKNNDDHPIYLDAVDLEPDQVDFFKQRFNDASAGVQHVFTDTANSDFFANCSQMLEDSRANFLDVSKRLANSFQSAHRGNTLDGAFIISIVRVEEERRLIFLLKIDHKKVYEYEIRDAKALLTEIKNTFVEDKKAIQKSALIDISDYYGWDVLANDRSGTAQRPVTQFFSSYLTVVEKDSPSSLTQKVVSAVRQWSVENKVEAGLREEVSAYKQRSVDYLRGTALFDADECIQAIFRDETPDVEVKERIVTKLKDYFDEKGLSGQSFVPNPGSLVRSVTKNIRRTAEGVTIEWDGEMGAKNISIPEERSPDGYYHITIKTNEIRILDKG